MMEPSLSPSTNPFVYDVADLRAINRQVVSWWLVAIYVVTFGGIAWFFGSLMWDDGAVSWLLVGILCALAILYSGPWIWRPMLTHRALRRQGLLVPQTIRIDPDYLTVVSERGDGHLKWTAVKNITRKGARLFIFASKTVAYIVPSRAFQHEQEFEAFAASAQQHWLERRDLRLAKDPEA